MAHESLVQSPPRFRHIGECPLVGRVSDPRPAGLALSVLALNFGNGFLWPPNALSYAIKAMLGSEAVERTSPQVHDAAIALPNRVDAHPLHAVRLPVVKCVSLPRRCVHVLKRDGNDSLAPNSVQVVAIQSASQVVERERQHL